jgi:hypothetical protein
MRQRDHGFLGLAAGNLVPGAGGLALDPGIHGLVPGSPADPGPVLGSDAAAHDLIAFNAACVKYLDRAREEPGLEPKRGVRVLELALADYIRRILSSRAIKLISRATRYTNV